MLIGPNEKEVATILVLVIFAYQRVKNKFDKNSGTFYLSEISSGPVVWGTLRHRF